MGPDDEMSLSHLKSDSSLKKVEVLTENADGGKDWVDVTKVTTIVTVREGSAEQALMEAMVQQQYQPITFRRICWPTPDRLCLLGRCGHCNDAPFRALGKIKHFIRHAPADWRPRLWDSYNSGKDNDFDQAQVWRGEWPKGVSRK